MSMIFKALTSEQQMLASLSVARVTSSLASRQYFKTAEANWLGKVKQVFAISIERLEEYKISQRIIFE